ncbi:glycosyltransferase [Pontibacter sp. H249]|uniref:glycosyltransferase n=1 Tax=Pontibacter sp. H249 TaxID=3133420 RepID=UPI0030BC1E15
MSNKVAGVVVLYNPETKVLKNICTYIPYLDKLFIIDNSDEASASITSHFHSIIPKQLDYIAFKENKGIATALNAAAVRAAQEGYDWILMMDQDSKFSEGQLDQLISLALRTTSDKVGIIASQYIENPANLTKPKVEEVYTAITSGSLLNLKAYKQVGSFRDDLFIDFVDHDYCLRLKLQGFKILVLNDVKLLHNLGNLTSHNLFGRIICTSNHNYLRRYYITRNRLEILKLYKRNFPEYLRTEKNKNLLEIVKVILLEKDKFRKLKSFLLGYLDFKRRRFGKYDY